MLAARTWTPVSEPPQVPVAYLLRANYEIAEDLRKAPTPRRKGDDIGRRLADQLERLAGGMEELLSFLDRVRRVGETSREVRLAVLASLNHPPAPRAPR